MTVDEILATGEYVDRRGRVWRLVGRRWTENVTYPRSTALIATGRFEYHRVMRLVIERDLHRDECPRVGVCRNHPVPRVTFCDVGGFDIWAAGELTKAEFARRCIATLPEAMDAARALAVGE